MGQTHGCLGAPKEESHTNCQRRLPDKHKRCIFLSMFRLNQCIEDIPSNILKESIFCFRMNTNEYEDEDSPTKLHPLFLQYCQQKRKQGLFLEIKDGTTWSDVSQQLTTIRDVYRPGNTTYDPLLLDHAFWEHEYVEDVSCFMVEKDEILHELSTNEFKFYPSMEIIVQSDASLVPMTCFNRNQYYAQCLNIYAMSESNSFLKRGRRALNKQMCLNADEDVFCVDEEEYFTDQYVSDPSLSSTKDIKDILEGFDSDS
eukprot:93744_1